MYCGIHLLKVGGKSISMVRLEARQVTRAVAEFFVPADILLKVTSGAIWEKKNCV